MATATWDIEARTVTDEHGYVWDVVADDGAAEPAVMVHRQADTTADADWAAGVYFAGRVSRRDDGATFGVNCQDEYIVLGGQWVENE